MEDQAKSQKKESIHTIKMKYSGLQVKSNEKDVHIKCLKDQLNEAEDKIMMLQKVGLCTCMYTIRCKQ